MVTMHDLLAVLQEHQGAEHGATAEYLAAKLDIEPRRVRALVTEARLDAYAVCGHPRNGYFMAATDADVEDTCQFLRSRAMRSLTLEARLRKCTLPELLGQMNLKT